jgi:hypothetical protein
MVVTAPLGPRASATLRRGRPWTQSPDVCRPRHTRVEASATVALAGAEVRPSAAVDSAAGVSAQAAGRVASFLSFDAAAARPWPGAPGKPSASLEVRADQRYRAPSYGAVVDRRARVKVDSARPRPWLTLEGVGRPVGGGSALGFELGTDLADCTALALSGELVAGAGGMPVGATAGGLGPKPAPGGSPQQPTVFKLTGWIPVGVQPRPGWRLDARGGGGRARARGSVCTGGGPPGTPLAASTWTLDLAVNRTPGGAELSTRLTPGGVRAGVSRGAGAARVAATVDAGPTPRASLTLGSGPGWAPAHGPVGSHSVGGAPRAGVSADARGAAYAWAFVPF